MCIRDSNNDWGFNYGADEGKLSELAGNLVAGGQNFKGDVLQ